MGNSGPFLELAESVMKNLEHQHDWTKLVVHTQADGKSLPRPLVTGLPPNRLYLHPDDQIKLVKAHSTFSADETPELEWVLPTHIDEKISLKSFAAVFDSIKASENAVPGRHKRLLLATIHDDSTVVYYFIHDGIVKPRQN